MPTKAHFVDVGQGNMTLLELADGKKFLYDCNVTDENQRRVLQYVANQIGWGTNIDVFICSHRDADHMRGVKKIDENFPIQHVWDTGVTGGTPNSSEYRDYMDLRRRVGSTEVLPRKYWDYGNTRLRVMNSKNNDLPNNANAQSIVVKVVHRNASANINHDSILLTGDTDAVTWKDILRHYDENDLSTSLLLASHHGSLSFFDDPSDSQYYYERHMRAMSPDMTFISVGPNSHGHPNKNAVNFYEKHSKGSSRGNKVYRTDQQRTIRSCLKDGGGWSIDINAT